MNAYGNYVSSLRTSHALQLERAPFGRFVIISEEHVHLHIHRLLLNHIALAALVRPMVALGALCQQDYDPVRPKGVVAF